MVSEMGFFFSFTALLEKSSTNSSKSTGGSTTFSHTSESTFLKIEEKRSFYCANGQTLNLVSRVREKWAPSTTFIAYSSFLSRVQIVLCRVMSTRLSSFAAMERLHVVRVIRCRFCFLRACKSSSPFLDMYPAVIFRALIRERKPWWKSIRC